MAGKDDDIERLLAEVDRSLSGGSTPAPGRERSPARREADGGGSALSTAAVTGVVAAAVVWLLFAVLPFLGAWSGAAGAFVGAAGTALVLGLMRRR